MNLMKGTNGMDTTLTTLDGTAAQLQSAAGLLDALTAKDEAHRRALAALAALFRDLAGNLEAIRPHVQDAPLDLDGHGKTRYNYGMGDGRA